MLFWILLGAVLGLGLPIIMGRIASMGERDREYRLVLHREALRAEMLERKRKNIEWEKRLARLIEYADNLERDRPYANLLAHRIRTQPVK